MQEKDPANAGTAQHQAAESPSPTYSFLVHSHSSLGNGGPPLKQENSIGTKSKRRRTSPQDHAILEAAYQKNSKPDKNERADIVSRVQLGEKEVQIWFQNRRQNDRRRSKPLQPHELLAHIRNHPSTVDPTITPLGPTEEAQTRTSGLPTHHGHPSPPLPDRIEPKRPDPRPSGVQNILNSPRSGETAILDFAKLASPPPTEQTSTSPSSSGAPKSQTCSDSPQQHSIDDDHSCNGSGKKRDHQQMLDGHRASKSEDLLPLKGVAPATKEPLKRSSSVRLAVTADGAVKIRTNNEPTPSPPKQRAPPPVSSAQRKSGLARSKSAFDNIEIFRDVGQNKTKQIGAGFGRSRDARTWEFYCDSSAKDALSTQMEAERNGSAVGAINLIRSGSSKSRLHALSPVPTRGNSRPSAGAGRAEKPKLSRARSSLARLQSSEADQMGPNSKTREVHHASSPSGDSDKENWAPGTRTSDNPLRRTQESTNRRPVLQENEGVIFQEPDSKNRPRHRDENDRLSSGRENARGEDLDCIQGLLSLSQGAWK